MLQRFIAVTLIACATGLLAACGSTVQSNQSNSIQPSSPTENTLQLNFPKPPSAEMKNELKREKYHYRSQQNEPENQASSEE